MKKYIITEELLTKFELQNINLIEFSENVRSHPYNPQAEREKVLESLKADIKTRLVGYHNSWSKGRNSGLLECCNIIDETLRQEGKVEK